jgi:hypothetical protein
MCTRGRFGNGLSQLWVSGENRYFFINQKLKSYDYQEMLCQQLLPVANNIGGQNWIFQQDSVPIHNSWSAKNWFSEQHIRVL